MPSKFVSTKRRGALLLGASLVALIVGCNQSQDEDARPNAEQAAVRRIVALGRLEPSGGIISISALPGEKLKSFAPGVTEGSKVAAGAELARVESFDLRQTQLEAAETKLEVTRKQRKREQSAAAAQLEQARAARAQADAKLQETLAQQQQLHNLSEATAIAQADLDQLQELHSSDPELVTEQQLRRRRNSAQRAAHEYESAAATYPHALEAARQSVAAATANERLAQENVALAKSVDQTVVAEVERRVAEQARNQSILRTPSVDGGSTEFSVLRILLQPGEFVAQLPVLEIGDLSKMVAIAEVYEADAKELAVGQTAVIRSPAFAGDFALSGIRGKVARVGIVVASPGLTNRNPLAPSDRSVVEVRVEIDPADAAGTEEAASRVGLQVTVEFDERTKAGASPSPSSAP
jgi:HlyD family secretion protein